MDAITALHTRNSVPRLQEPGPEPEVLDNILKAGLRANDHARLRPWRFLVIRGESRNKLGEIFVQAKLTQQPELSDEERDKLASKPLRAPVIITVAANTQGHPKVPEIEQIISAGAAAQLMMVAAHAQGIGAIWRTGAMAYDPLVHRGLGLETHQKIIGFLYLGTPAQPKSAPELELADYLENWS